jgi:hypothetical protein
MADYAYANPPYARSNKTVRILAGSGDFRYKQNDARGLKSRGRFAFQPCRPDVQIVSRLRTSFANRPPPGFGAQRQQ